MRAASSKSGVRSMLTTFLSKRPDRQDLRSKGIVKERMFGCDLAEHLVNARRDGLLLPLALSLSISPNPGFSILRLLHITIRKSRRAREEEDED